ncbi:MAG TPA: RHS repeat-associated core domain-containing protein [Candidatus Limnocylindrales bacterium]|nr:RHS repeat-associated core domain-containing protein [Candidatus Limnocylindrales bacterium]
MSASRFLVGLLAVALIAPAAAFAPARVAAASARASLEIYTDDEASRLTAIGDALGATVVGDLSYTYDRAGRRTTAGGSLARVSLPAAVGSTTYNAANQLTKWATNQTKPTYDANGNTLTDGTLSYVWNARDELVTLKTGNTVTASFAYDGLGRRIAKTVSGTTTRFAFDRANVVQEQNAAGTPTANLLTGGLDQTFGRTDAAGARTLLTDALGSTVALADAAGVVGTSYTYEPYGKTSQSGPANANSQQFTGRENDGPLYYYRARYYQPTFGRFVSEHPAGFAAGDPNLYRYVGGSPTNLTDPSGRWLDSFIDAAFIASDLWTITTGSRKDADAAWGSLGLDLLGLLLPGVTGLGLIGRVASRADDTVELFRAVGRNELVDIATTGVLRPTRQSMAGKWFAESVDDASRWAEWFSSQTGRPTSVVRVTVDRAAADSLARVERLDGIGPARYGEGTALDRLNAGIRDIELMR